MNKNLTAHEMDKIRADDAVLQEVLKRDFVPEPVQYKDGIVLVISRCIKGPQGWAGLFKLEEVQMEDEKGKKLKIPIRRTLVEGRDRDGIMTTVDRAIGRRYFT